ncbi:hypothetical protein PoB_005965700 [Plakobranchus ocellatus]|uniref:Uncharacterized protein n=1 Tax=Plakobranchus ocellatus TaxID=259542 RepID=A0AAV4CN07_9GAST|nr:hypothetical protein PoB_005965700 [Plakobranchus ocellatus]
MYLQGILSYCLVPSRSDCLFGSSITVLCNLDPGSSPTVLYYLILCISKGSSTIVLCLHNQSASKGRLPLSFDISIRVSPRVLFYYSVSSRSECIYGSSPTVLCHLDQSVSNGPVLLSCVISITVILWVLFHCTVSSRSMNLYKASTTVSHNLEESDSTCPPPLSYVISIHDIYGSFSTGLFYLDHGVFMGPLPLSRVTLIR